MSKKPTEQEEIDRIVADHKKRKRDEKVVVTYDENGNRYVHYDGEWIG